MKRSVQHDVKTRWLRSECECGVDEMGESVAGVKGNTIDLSKKVGTVGRCY